MENRSTSFITSQLFTFWKLITIQKCQACRARSLDLHTEYSIVVGYKSRTRAITIEIDKPTARCHVPIVQRKRGKQFLNKQGLTVELANDKPNVGSEPIKTERHSRDRLTLNTRLESRRPTELNCAQLHVGRPLYIPSSRTRLTGQQMRVKSRLLASLRAFSSSSSFPFAFSGRPCFPNVFRAFLLALPLFEKLRSRF